MTRTGAASVLMISTDTIDRNMAGIGIRYWNLARVVGQAQPVTLAIPNVTGLAPPAGVRLISYGGTDDDRGHQLAKLIEDHDVVVAQHIPHLYTDEATLRERFLIVDLHAPWILEKLELARVDPEIGEPNRKDDVAILNRLLRLGDAFICASERQRDFWLGALADAGRLELAQAQADPDLRHLIDVVPFGIPPDPPIVNGPGPRQTMTGIDDDSRLILWNGGLWNWLDPLTAIRAMARVVEREERARLVFMGVRSPVSGAVPMHVVDDARELATQLGLLDRYVFFNDWVPYEQRQNWLLEADLSISLHVRTLESRFAYRTRMLDNLWCGLPLVATRGDVLADLAEQAQIGLTVPPEDPAAVSTAILTALSAEHQREFRSNLTRQVERHTWERVARPLAAWCQKPTKIGTHGQDERDRYVHRIERIYAETAEYARRLERVVAEKNQVIESNRITMKNLARLTLKRLRGGGQR